MLAKQLQKQILMKTGQLFLTFSSKTFFQQLLGGELHNNQFIEINNLILIIFCFQDNSTIEKRNQLFYSKKYF